MTFSRDLPLQNDGKLRLYVYLERHVVILGNELATISSKIEKFEPKMII